MSRPFLSGHRLIEAGPWSWTIDTTIPENSDVTITFEVPDDQIWQITSGISAIQIRAEEMDDADTEDVDVKFGLYSRTGSFGAIGNSLQVAVPANERFTITPRSPSGFSYIDAPEHLDDITTAEYTELIDWINRVWTPGNLIVGPGETLLAVEVENNEDHELDTAEKIAGEFPIARYQA